MGQPTLRVLVTNDDGISSEGIRHLALVAQAAALDVVVAAPRDQASGSSASLTAVEAEGRILVEDRHLDGLEGVPTYAVAATPGFITLIATRGAFGPPPDVVMSGINRGANTGRAILHSGTVDADLTAGANGCRALAVSLAGESPSNWETAWEPGSDATLIALRFATLTPLNPICEAQDVQLAGVPLPDDSENHAAGLEASLTAPTGRGGRSSLGGAG